MKVKEKGVILIVLMLAAMVFSGCRHAVEIKTLPEIQNPVKDVATDPAQPLLCGFASEVITPERPAWIAGFGMLRLSWGVHDDIFARALLLKQGDEKLAMVSMDLIGIQRNDVEMIKARIKGFRPDQVLIACTHTHSGPDTMGLWGLPPIFSGRNKKYIEKIAEATALAIERAEQSARPVTAWTAVYKMNPDIMYNANKGEPKDDTMGIMVFKDKSDAFVATLVNLAGHPEVRWGNNHYISADYPGVVYEMVEEGYGGGAILFNGALGAMITPKVSDNPARRTWEEVERIGSMVMDDVERGMELLVKEDRPSIVHKVSLIRTPLKNQNFVMLGEYGIIERNIYEGQTILTQVHLIEIGSAQFVTFPGEAYPKQGLKIRERQKPHSFQIGLADDELGYILYPEDYGTELYRYETSMCVGPELSIKMEKAISNLLKN